MSLKHGAQAAERAVVYVHGGPTSQSVNSFSRIIQTWLTRATMVVAPNYRGSTGYGKEFQQANLFDNGRRVCRMFCRWPISSSRRVTRSKKLALMGGSYGGYMTMMRC